MGGGKKGWSKNEDSSKPRIINGVVQPGGGVMSERAIRLIGGPLDGIIHELQGFIPPEKIALPSHDGKYLLWYRIEGATAQYEKTEPRKLHDR